MLEIRPREDPEVPNGVVGKADPWKRKCPVSFSAAGTKRSLNLGSIWSRGTVLALDGVLIFTPLLLISSTLLQIAPSVVCQSS